MTCGAQAFLLALDSPRVFATADPLVAGILRAQFWALWEKADGRSPDQAPTKLDHMRLPDPAPRSNWTVSSSILDDIRSSQRATFLLNLESVRGSYLRMRELLPEIGIRYSVKTNPDSWPFLRELPLAPAGVRRVWPGDVPVEARHIPGRARRCYGVMAAE